MNPYRDFTMMQFPPCKKCDMPDPDVVWHGIGGDGKHAPLLIPPNPLPKYSIEYFVLTCKRCSFKTLQEISQERS